MIISSIFAIVTGITKLHKHHKVNNSRSGVGLLLVKYMLLLGLINAIEDQRRCHGVVCCLVFIAF